MIMFCFVVLCLELCIEFPDDLNNELYYLRCFTLRISSVLRHKDCIQAHYLYYIHVPLDLRELELEIRVCFMI